VCFHDPPAEPDVPVSGHPALHKVTLFMRRGPMGSGFGFLDTDTGQ
jgi:hypothetical protein